MCPRSSGEVVNAGCTAPGGDDGPRARARMSGWFGRSRHTADRVAAAVLLAFGLVVLVTSLGYGLFLDGQPGPGLFPAVVAAALCVVSVCWLVIGAGKLPEASEGSQEDHVEDSAIDRSGMRRIGFVVLWSLGPILLLDSIGYLPAMVLYVGGLLVFVARVRVWVSLLGTTAGVILSAIGASALGLVMPDPLNIFTMIGL
jgi:Tripartite tricarboxylate transporter TctB family